jgi:hypothetical protein
MIKISDDGFGVVGGLAGEGVSTVVVTLVGLGLRVTVGLAVGLTAGGRVG